MHFKRKSSRSQPTGDSTKCHFPDGCPRWWNLMNHIRPRRRADKKMAQEVLKGADPDGLPAPLSKKPHSWYW